MDLSKTLAELKAERDKIEGAIQSLEQLARDRDIEKPPLEGVGAGVRVPRPKPKFPPAAVALPVPPVSAG
jgi:hypothetical protein